MSCVAWEVELDIPVCQFYGLGRAVHRVYQLSPASHGIDRETARIAEHIEYATPFGIAFQ